MNTVMLKTLSGGSGLTLGQMRITDRSGKDRDDRPVGRQDAAGRARHDQQHEHRWLCRKGGREGLGQRHPDHRRLRRNGDLIIEDVTASTATNLGLNGTFTNTTPTAVGKNLQRQWVNENTLLSSLNGGKGVTPAS
jgi:hypothetical protein